MNVIISKVWYTDFNQRAVGFDDKLNEKSTYPLRKLWEFFFFSLKSNLNNREITRLE